MGFTCGCIRCAGREECRSFTCPACLSGIVCPCYDKPLNAKKPAQGSSEAAAAGENSQQDQKSDEAREEGVFTGGVRVEVTGLSSKPELNGCVGVVLAPGLLPNGRVAVKLRVCLTKGGSTVAQGEQESEGEEFKSVVVSVRQTNLTPLHEKEEEVDDEDMYELKSPDFTIRVREPAAFVEWVCSSCSHSLTSQQIRSCLWTELFWRRSKRIARFTALIKALRRGVGIGSPTAAPDGVNGGREGVGPELLVSDLGPGSDLFRSWFANNQTNRVIVEAALASGSSLALHASHHLVLSPALQAVRRVDRGVSRRQHKLYTGAPVAPELTSSSERSSDDETTQTDETVEEENETGKGERVGGGEGAKTGKKTETLYGSHALPHISDAMRMLTGESEDYMHGLRLWSFIAGALARIAPFSHFDIARAALKSSHYAQMLAMAHMDTVLASCHHFTVAAAPVVSQVKQHMQSIQRSSKAISFALRKGPTQRLLQINGWKPPSSRKLDPAVADRLSATDDDENDEDNSKQQPGSTASPLPQLKRRQRKNRRKAVR